MMVIVFPLRPSGWSVGLTYLVPSSVRIKELGKDELQLQANHILCAWAEHGACWDSRCVKGSSHYPQTVCVNQRAVWVTLSIRRQDCTET